jgi:hypothetical protein
MQGSKQYMKEWKMIKVKNVVFILAFVFTFSFACTQVKNDGVIIESGLFFLDGNRIIEAEIVESKIPSVFVGEYQGVRVTKTIDSFFKDESTADWVDLALKKSQFSDIFFTNITKPIIKEISYGDLIIKIRSEPESFSVVNNLEIFRNNVRIFQASFSGSLLFVKDEKKRLYWGYVEWGGSGHTAILEWIEK